MCDLKGACRQPAKVVGLRINDLRLSNARSGHRKPLKLARQHSKLPKQDATKTCAGTFRNEISMDLRACQTPAECIARLEVPYSYILPCSPAPKMSSTPCLPRRLQGHHFVAVPSLSAAHTIPRKGAGQRRIENVLRKYERPKRWNVRCKRIRSIEKWLWKGYYFFTCSGTCWQLKKHLPERELDVINMKCNEILSNWNNLVKQLPV